MFIEKNSCRMLTHSATLKRIVCDGIFFIQLYKSFGYVVQGNIPNDDY